MWRHIRNSLPSREEGLQGNHATPRIRKLHTGVHHLHCHRFIARVSEGEAGLHPWDISRGVQNVKLCLSQAHRDATIFGSLGVDLYRHFLLLGGHGDEKGRNPLIYPESFPHLQRGRCFGGVCSESSSRHVHWTTHCVKYLRLLLPFLRIVHFEVNFPTVQAI